MVNWTFIERDEVDSTQSIAKRLASDGAPEGTTVVAKSQSSGSGRLSRSWASPPGGLYMSFIIRPKSLYRPEFITLVSAVAVVEGIKKTTDLDASIRWPNDVIRGKRKLAGIIADAQTFEQEITQVIVGVGVNCNTPVSGLELSSKATSLSEELGRPIVISELKQAILDSFSNLYGRWQAGEDMVPVWTIHISTLGRRITIKLKTTETPFSCVAAEVDLDGGLLVEVDGETVLIRPEDLEWLREEP